MQRYLLKISYDGTSYHGWQVQKNGITVQETLQNAMKQLYGFRPSVTGCSRTDAGVHAKEFYCHFELENEITPEGIIKGLNSVLPIDIRALNCNIVDSNFHARYNAKGKNYTYRIDRRLITDPFNSRYSYNYSGSLNLDDMRFFCNSLIGEHDFKGFSSSKRSVTDTVRTVFECDITETEEFLTFSISANGFLYNMVRIITGTLVDVSTGRFAPEDIGKILETKDRTKSGRTAPPQGLYLNQVFY